MYMYMLVQFDTFIDVTHAQSCNIKSLLHVYVCET